MQIMIQIMPKKDNCEALVSSDKNLREFETVNLKEYFWKWKQKPWRIQAAFVRKSAKVSPEQLPTEKMRGTRSRTAA